MQRAYDELKNDGFEIVAVDLMEEREKVQAFVDEYKLNFPVLLDIKGSVGARYGIQSIPTTYLIDRRGFIFGRMIGTRERDTKEVLAVFKEILKKER